MSDETPLKQRDDAAGRLLRQLDEETAAAAAADARVWLLEGAERRLAEPARAPWLRVALATTVALVAVASAVWLTTRSDVRVTGGELILSGRAVGEGARIPLGVPVRSTSGGTFVVNETATVALQGEAVIERLDAVALQQGGARFTVHKGPFQVRLGRVELEAVTATFSVAGDLTGVVVKVIEGRLTLRHESGQVELQAGDVWPPTPPVAPVHEPAPPAEMPQPPETPEQKAQTRERLTRLEKAAELTRRGQLARARAIYRQLADEDAPVAEVALYNLSRLEMRKAKSTAAALAALEEQLRRFPKGALAHEAQLGRVEALRALGRKDEALKASEEIGDAGSRR